MARSDDARERESNRLGWVYDSISDMSLASHIAKIFQATDTANLGLYSEAR